MDNENDIEEEEYLYFGCAVFLASFHGLHASASTRVRREPSPRGYEIVQECLRNDRCCMDTTRMDSNTLRELVDIFRDRYGVSTYRGRLSLEEEVVMTLNYFAHAGSMGQVSTMFGHVKDTMSNILSRMLVPLGQLFVDEVKHVDQSVVHQKFKTTPTRRCFQGCIGALDGTHVHIHPPSKDQGLWRGRLRIPSTNILAICDHNLLFTYFISGAEGTNHDTRVLDICRDDPTYNFPHPEPGKYYLCDSGYVNRDGYMTPFRFRRYHPHEFEHEGPEDSEEYFNMVHSGLRSVIERTFGVWKNKWHIVHKGYSLKSFELHKAMAIIDATAALHNFVRRRMGDNYLEPVNADATEEDVSIDLNCSPPPEYQELGSDRAEIARTIYGLR